MYAILSPLSLALVTYLFHLVSDHVARVVRDHIVECKSKIQALRYALPIIIPESNIPIAQDLMRRLKGELGMRCAFMTEDHDASAPVAYDRPGSVTTHKNKEAMVDKLTKRLAEGRIVMHTQFVVAAQDHTLKNIEKELVDEFRTFSEFRKRVRLVDGSYETRRYHSGKCIGHNDDFVMAVAIGGEMKDRFYQKEKYRVLH